jgi:hypothetical protein
MNLMTRTRSLPGTFVVAMTAACAIGVTASPVFAQGRPPSGATAAGAVAEARDLRESRYQLGQMERLLEGAVEHGATIIRERLRALVPADMLLSENARARGFRLIGYGVFFDVEVPSLEGTLPWSFRTLDQNGVGLLSAWNAVRSHIESDSAGDPTLQQAIKRLELQVAPLAASQNAVPLAASADPRPIQPGLVRAQGQADAPDDPTKDDVLKDPEEAYREAVRDALMGTMLEHSRGLSVQPTEWLTVAARRNESGPRLAPAESDARTIVIRVSGADLTAFLAGQISRDEARRRVEVRVF